MKGILFVVSGPSGAGKGTILETILREAPSVRFSVSATTRSPRQGEREGVHYHFLSREVFKSMAGRDEFLEWAHVHDEYYGTPRRAVEECLASGNDMVLDIDVQGGLQLMDREKEAVFVFVAPPDIAELRRRLEGRGTESGEKIARRIEVAKHELTFVGSYEYCIVNDSLEEAIASMKAVMTAERLKTKRGKYLFV
ncbi:MAG: guanylate kinase [Candidatus Eremiobacteraeota bacterium]|nr:guanylate kinase [Candidatus Eremiobacteraeota bacterium]